MSNPNAYNSPSAERYGCSQLLGIWSDRTKRTHWRMVWAALAAAQSPALVPAEATARIWATITSVDVSRALEVESSVKHDLVAELTVFQEQLGADGRYLHLGATSSDIQDNADALRVRGSLKHIRANLEAAISGLLDMATRSVAVKTIGWTHLQTAEPLNVGLRWATYAYDLAQTLRGEVFSPTRGFVGKGFKGPVGNYAGYLRLYDGRILDVLDMEQRACSNLSLPYHTLARQTSPRTQEWQLLATLCEIAAVLHKLHQDIRLLCSPAIGELHERDVADRIGSSAMPAKVNPITSEKVCSLARLLPAFAAVIWDDAAMGWLERDLTDSANRRYVLPEALLVIDHLLEETCRLLPRLVLDVDRVTANLQLYSNDTFTAALLQESFRAGGDPNQARVAIRDVVVDQRQRPGLQTLEQRLASDERLGLDEATIIDVRRKYAAASEHDTEMARQLLLRLDGDIRELVDL